MNVLLLLVWRAYNYFHYIDMLFFYRVTRLWITIYDPILNGGGQNNNQVWLKKEKKEKHDATHKTQTWNLLIASSMQLPLHQT
jgi:hypothetical protein